MPGLNLVVSDGDVGENARFTLALEDVSGSRGVFSIFPETAVGRTPVIIKVADSSHLDYEDPSASSFVFKGEWKPCILPFEIIAFILILKFLLSCLDLWLTLSIFSKNCALESWFDVLVSIVIWFHFVLFIRSVMKFVYYNIVCSNVYC